MNQKTLWLKRREVLMHFDRYDAIHHGCVRFGDNEGEWHQGRKMFFASVAVKAKDEFWTEIRSGNMRFRADMLIFKHDTGTADIVEFADSESDESLERKRSYWEGKGFTFIIVKKEVG